MFSGGSYEDVQRWLRNFLTSHAKRENPRAEVAIDAEDDRVGKSYAARLRLGERLSGVIELEAGDGREGTSYAARVRLGSSVSAPIELEFADVARNREGLEWCAKLAVRVREVVRDLAAAAA